MNVYDLASAINKKGFTLVAYQQRLDSVLCEPESKLRQAKLAAAMRDVRSIRSEIASMWDQVISTCRSKFELLWMEDHVYYDYSQRQKISRFKESESFFLLPNR